MDDVNHHLTVIKLNLNAIYSKEMCVWLNVAQMKAEEMYYSLKVAMIKQHLTVINLNICINNSIQK